MRPWMRTALDPPGWALIVAFVAWLALFVVIAVASLGIVSFAVALVWAALLLYLATVIVYAFAQEDEVSPVRRWTRAAMEARTLPAVAIGLWIALSFLLAISIFGINLGGITFVLAFAWAVLLVYLIAVAIQDYVRQQDESA